MRPFPCEWTRFGRLAKQLSFGKTSMRSLAAAIAGPAPNTTIPGAAPTGSVGRLVLLTWTHVAPGEVVTAVSMNAKARLASLLRRPSARRAALAPMAGFFATEATTTGSPGRGLGG